LASGLFVVGGPGPRFDASLIERDGFRWGARLQLRQRDTKLREKASNCDKKRHNPTSLVVWPAAQEASAQTPCPVIYQFIFLIYIEK
jgi:hypothetical protein